MTGTRPASGGATASGEDPEVAPSLALRLAATATAAAGTATLTTAGVVPAAAALVTVALALGATLAARTLVTPVGRAARRRLAVAVLGLAALSAAFATGGELSATTATALGLLLCTAVVTHALVIDTVRDARVNLAVSASMLVLAAGLAPGLSLAGPVVLTWVGAIAGLVLAARDAEGAGAAARATTEASEPVPWTPVAGAVVATVLVGLAISLLLPQPAGLSGRAGFGRDANVNGFGDANRTAQAYLGAGELTLDSRGRLDESPVAVVTGTEPRLWRSNVLESYDGTSWSNAPRDALVLAGEGATEAAVPADPRSPAQPRPQLRSDGVGWVLAGVPDATVLTPGLPERVRLREPGQVVRESDGRLVAWTASSTPSFVVDAVAVPSVNEPGLTESEPGTAADAEAVEWLALPPTVPRRVADLAREVSAGSSSRLDTVRAVEQYVRGAIGYDLDSPVTPAGADTVDDVLFRTKLGFCEHYASAEVVMLRSLGVPARLVTGFTGGTPDGEGRSVLRSSDAHAWVEAWIPGTGWVSSDPTEGSVRAESRAATLLAAVRRGLDGATDGPVRRTALAALLVGLAVAAAALPGRRRRAGAAPTAAPVPLTPLIAAFGRLEAALAAAGRPREPAESVRALARRLDATDDVVGALLAVERASYAPVPPTRAEVRAATDVLDRTAARLLAVAATDRREIVGRSVE